MPEDLTPGVFTGETGLGLKPILSVPTATAGFVGQCLSGPSLGPPTLVTNFAEFERRFGGLDNLVLDGAPTPNYMAHAVRLFFENGGQRAYIARIFQPAQGDLGHGGGPDDSGEMEARAETFVGGGSGPSAIGLAALAEVDEIAIVAAPGGGALSSVAERGLVRGALIRHCEALRHRFAILSDEADADLEAIRAVRASHDSSRAALYYPWLAIADPARGQAAEQLLVPPDGVIAGVYARCDAQHGVHHAPANEPILGTTGLSRTITQGEQEVLNPEGINCLRAFAGRGDLVWGARTLSTDPEWKYVNVRRLLMFLEHSIDRGTQWAAFEPNAEPLWLQIRGAIENFLQDGWRTGALAGAKPSEAYFVRCDRTTMTQDDIDQGRLVCLIGVAPLRPAEFVTFRIGQWTADHEAPGSPAHAPGPLQPVNPKVRGRCGLRKNLARRIRAIWPVR